MASEFQPNDDWERVASELRAYREAQEQAWGRIDNATLGRFIADELNSEERRQIEHALGERPELRKLTDLVREVLADFEPAAERSPTPPVPLPRILPFPSKQPSRPSVVRWAKKRSGMLVAACLLLALCGSLLDPRVGSTLLGGSGDAPRAGASPEGAAFAMVRSGNQPFYVRVEKPVESMASIKEQSPGERFAYAPGSAGLNRLEILNHKIDGLEQQGKWQEALALDERAVTVAQRANLEQHLEYAVNREKVADISRKQGDLGRAYDSLAQAYEIRKKEQGLHNKDTAKTGRSLANMYAVAINTGGDGPANYEVTAKVLTPISPPPPAPLTIASRTVPVRHPESDHKNVVELRDRLAHQDAAFVRKQVVPVMVQGLENAATEKEREEFVRALGNLGPNAAPAAPYFVVRLQQAQAAEDLKKTVPAVAPVAAETSVGLTTRERCVTLWALGRVGPALPDAVPVLVEALDSSSPAVSRTAADALVQLGPPARESLGHYLKVEANDGAAEVRRRMVIQTVLKRLDERGPAQRETVRVRRDALGIVVGPAAERAPLSPTPVGD